jgi:hypothetical protein
MKFDFIWNENVTFPLTFKVISEIEGVYNHTSAQVTVGNNPNIEACNYTYEGQTSTCSKGNQCCGVGTL